MREKSHSSRFEMDRNVRYGAGYGDGDGGPRLGDGDSGANSDLSPKALVSSANAMRGNNVYGDLLFNLRVAR